ncbi:MAG: GyrI-like domain-containing protein [Desulfovibrio sp.]|nr:GyrI-like domain-containing protein [Desulfovibrio sp.]MBI4958990.1 GyrI-like domain-containing protein [Desulfovibrio sp.]
MATEKIDLFALNKAEYAATRTPKLVTVDTAWFLSIEGSGHPREPLFQQSVQALYSVAYTLKMQSKKNGRDYVISKLEGLWHLDPGYFDFASAPQSAWNWTLLLRTPDFIGENDLDRVQAELLAKGKSQLVKRVGVMGFEEGQCVQMLHVGPYDKEDSTLEIMHAFIEKKQLTVVGRHHEIYLSDPSRTASDKLRTIIRLPVI